MTTLPTTMTAAVTARHGGPDAIRVHGDWEVPRPGPGEALVKVRAAALNNTDLWSREGAYGTGDDPNTRVGWRGAPLDFPRIQGADVAGVVAAVGSARDDHLVGRRVIVDPAIVYEDDRPVEILGSETDGGFAEFVVVPVARVHDVSDAQLTDEQLACLPIAYATALGMIERAVCVPGDRVLVTGASGGVGLAALQILAYKGCTVTALTSTGKAEAVEETGADRVILRDTGDPIDGTFEVVVDLVGGDRFGEVLDTLVDRGRLVTAGAIAGPVVRLDLRRVYLRHRSILGSTMHTPDLFRAVVGMARDGAVSPRVAASFSLAEIHIAQAEFERKEFVGKIVVLP